MKKFFIIIISIILTLCLSGCTGLPEYFRNGTVDNVISDIEEPDGQSSYTENNEKPDEQVSHIDKEEPDEKASHFDDEEPDEQTSHNETAGVLPSGIFPFSFTAQDLFGNTVTEESLGEKQLFFVHLWATWCPPCIVEMPDIAVITEEYSDRVGFLGLLEDFSTNLDGALNIVESANKPDSFINIDARLPELSDLLSLVHTGYVPTTVIITANGEIFEPLIGAYGAAYAAILDMILEGNFTNE